MSEQNKSGNNQGSEDPNALPFDGIQDPNTPVGDQDPGPPPTSPDIPIGGSPVDPIPMDFPIEDTPVDPADADTLVTDTMPAGPSEPHPDFPYGNPNDPIAPPVGPNAGSQDGQGRFGRARAKVSGFRPRLSRNAGEDTAETDENPADIELTTDPNDPAAGAKRAHNNVANASTTQQKVDHKNARKAVDEAIETIAQHPLPDKEVKIERIEKLPWRQQRLLESKFANRSIGKKIVNRFFSDLVENSFGQLEYQTGEKPTDRRYQRYRVAEEMRGWLLPDVVRPRNNPTNGVATARSTSDPEKFRVDPLVVSRDGKKTFAGVLEANVSPGNESQRERTVAVGEDIDVLSVPTAHSKDDAGKLAKLFGGKERQVYGRAMDDLTGVKKRISIPQHLPAQTEKLEEIRDKLLSIAAPETLFDPDNPPPKPLGPNWVEETELAMKEQAKAAHEKAEAQEQARMAQQAIMNGRALAHAMRAERDSAEINADYYEAHDINDAMKVKPIVLREVKPDEDED